MIHSLTCPYCEFDFMYGDEGDVSDGQQILVCCEMCSNTFFAEYEVRVQLTPVIRD